MIRRNDDALGILHFAAVTSQQYVTQGDGFTGFTSQLFNRDLVSGGNPVLFAARAHNCEHGALIRSFQQTTRRFGQRIGP